MPPPLLVIPTQLIPAIGYIRVSMAREEMISPAIQRAAIIAWALRMGRRVIRWIEDPDMSGRNFRRRVMKGIEAIEAREVVEIVVYRYDRWGRNALESLANITRVERAGGQVQSATEPVDAETAIGRYNRHNALGLAEMQSDLISENWQAAHANRLGRQLPSAGTARFGYTRLGRLPDPVEPHRYRRDVADTEGERYEPDYAGGTADDLTAMYDKYIDGKGFPQVAQWLNVRGRRNVRGSVWSDVTVKNVLDSGFAAGLLQVHDPACPCRKPSNCSKRIHIPGAQPAILDQAAWEQYRQVRAERGKRPPRARYPSYPLTGLILCGHCCSPMKPQSGAGQAGYGYRCGRWHHYRDCPDAPFPRRAYVEAEVRGQLARWARDIDELAAATVVRQKKRISAEADRDRLLCALAEEDAALARLEVQKARAGAQMPEAVYEAARAEMLTSRSLVEAELVAAEGPAQVATVDFVPIVRSVLDSWDILPAMQVRDLLSKLIRHVKVYRRADGQPKVVLAPRWEPCADCAVCAKRTT